MKLRHIDFVKDLFVQSLAHLRQLPDFLIIGAQRCGTTSLYKYLVEHPCIVPATKKEVHYFDLNYEKGHLWYRMHFPMHFGKLIGRATDQFCLAGEASPYYIFHPLVPGRIAELMPQVKLVALLRNPVERAYSHYHHVLKAGLEQMSFEEAIACEQQCLYGEGAETNEGGIWASHRHQHFSYLSRGIYVDQLERWFLLFPRKNIMILKSEHFYENPRFQVSRVFRFLSLSNWYIKEPIKYNRLEYPRMAPHTRDSLTEFFRPHNERLYEFLGIDFGWQ